MSPLISLYTEAESDLELPWLEPAVSVVSVSASHTLGFWWLSRPPRLYMGSGNPKFGLHSSSVSPAQYLFLIVLYFF